MALIARLRSTVGGMLWLVRAGGLRTRLQRLDEVSTRLDQIERQMETREAASAEAVGSVLQAVRDLGQQSTRGRLEQARDLRAFENRVHSQNGEDGILREILGRIGTTNRFFVEFGVESGSECNCAELVFGQQWHGLFLEAADHYFRSLSERYREHPGVKCVQAIVTSTNIENLLEANGVPTEFDVLSIDIDGNDYWVWSAIRRWRPRVVVIEYNASFPPPRKWVMQEDPTHRWNGTNYFGASLASLAALGRAKGYTLVATDSRGVNAFFVRDELVAADRFLDPVAAYHYSPPRYGPHLGGHPPGSGPSVEV
ncbi:FkbM family methyltransferase [Frigoriglobus tundricola]|uniref:Methyltransferase FkbM domain-containing protein n=1 Tax=Frigoriglobus tundricola TaxID=2774151 RepID=A0A6M5Z2Y4_9BACT|nr:FkbM family methyltransferase [Frigoriglobus tundricola]QJW99910.1 Uncharacterized protein FTUN_7533 [Frigoriglobus tundricola]